MHSATTYYVAKSSGDDSNTSTIGNPFKTIQKAADLAMLGDTIFVNEGVYREHVAPPKDHLKCIAKKNGVS